MVLALVAVGCGGGDDDEADTLTCAWVYADDQNCFDPVAIALYECMGRRGDTALVEGDFDAPAMTCTDSGDPGRRAVFDPPKPTRPGMRPSAANTRSAGCSRG